MVPEFRASLRVVIARIEAKPKPFPAGSRRTRRALLRRFPCRDISRDRRRRVCRRRLSQEAAIPAFGIGDSVRRLRSAARRRSASAGGEARAMAIETAWQP